MNELLPTLITFALIFGIFWFFLIRPQKKKEQQHQDMVDNLRVGDKIITIGGIKGKVIKIKDNIITLRITSDVDIEVIKNAIGRLDKSDKKKK